MNAKGKWLKRAWIRDNTAPAGTTAKGRFNCPCNNAPLVDLIENGPDTICNCGRRYDWQGCIKGRSIGSDTLTAYQIIFEDGSSYCTTMSETTNLQDAYNYFMDRRFNRKLVVDVEPYQLMIYMITYYTLGDSVQTEEITAKSLEDAIEILIADEKQQYCFASLKSYTIKQGD